MAVSFEQLARKLNSLDLYARSMLEDEISFINSSSPTIHGVSDLLSGSGEDFKDYRASLGDAFGRLDFARQALRTGALVSAARFLESADQRLKLAEMRWVRSVGASGKGGARGEIVVGAGAVVALSVYWRNRSAWIVGSGFWWHGWHTWVRTGWTRASCY